MKRRLILIPAAALIGIGFMQGTASAHTSNVQVDPYCVDGTSSTAVRFTNDMVGMTAIAELDGHSVLVPPVVFDPQLAPNGLPGHADIILTPTSAVTLNYTVTWEDGFDQSGSIDVAPTDGCTPPTTVVPVCPEQVNGPACQPVPTYPPPTEVCPTWLETPPPCAPAAPIVDRAVTSDAVVLGSSQVIEREPELAFTGDHTEVLILAGLAMVAVGGVLLGCSKRRPS